MFGPGLTSVPPPPPFLPSADPFAEDFDDDTPAEQIKNDAPGGNKIHIRPSLPPPLPLKPLLSSSPSHPPLSSLMTLLTLGSVQTGIQQRNGRKTLTTLQGLPKQFDPKKILKAFKKVPSPPPPFLLLPTPLLLSS